MTKPGYVYVASSWRCAMQPAVIQVLRASGIDCYDFRNPEGGTGFGRAEVMPSFEVGLQLADADEYVRGLDHPRAVEGFDSDFAAMEKADTFVLVLPCGRSAHLELGWAVGAGKRTAILLDPSPDTNEVTPELMYKMVDHLSTSLFDLLGWLGVETLEDKLRADDEYDRMQAYWASPEGVAWQVAEFREHWVPSRPGDDS